MISQKDLLLIPFPFSDKSGRKVRPVVVIGNDKFNVNSEDIVIESVTSIITKDKHTLNLISKDIKEGKLLTRCCIKVENILKMIRN